jgi:hypothetical protein
MLHVALGQLEDGVAERSACEEPFGDVPEQNELSPQPVALVPRPYRVQGRVCDLPDLPDLT